MSVESEMIFHNVHIQNFNLVKLKIFNALRETLHVRNKDIVLKLKEQHASRQFRQNRQHAPVIATINALNMNTKERISIIMCNNTGFKHQLNPKLPNHPLITSKMLQSDSCAQTGTKYS